MNWLILMVALAQIDAPKAAPKVRRDPVLTKVADPYDATAWALQDALAMRVADPPTTARGCVYIWIGPTEDANIAKINALAVNSSLSHSGTIQLPDLTAGGRLIRWDCHKLCPKPADFKRLVGVLNFLGQGEPFWHTDLRALGLKPAKVSPFVWIDGREYSHTFSVPAPATAEAYQLLQAETGLRVPLMRADYFLRKISSTVQGGVYYEARGFVVYDQHGKRRKLNETEILAKLGVSAKLSRAVEGDDRVGIVRSNVTGQARAVEFIQGAIGPVRLSYDRTADNENVLKHPLYNLLSVTELADGKETIFTLPNGLLGYIATNGKGELVDEVPANIATDHRTPVPHPARLFAPLSCVRCHGPNGGVQKTPNDVQRLLRNPKDLDAFADFSGTGLSRVDVDRLAGLYGGDFERRARDARNHYGDACFTATRGLTAQDAAAAWANQYEAYWESPVTAETQLRDLGWTGRSPQAVNSALETLLVKAEKDLVVDGQKASLEDPLRPAPRMGIPIRRPDAERIQAESFRRAYLHRNEVN